MTLKAEDKITGDMLLCNTPVGRLNFHLVRGCDFTNKPRVLHIQNL